MPSSTVAAGWRSTASHGTSAWRPATASCCRGGGPSGWLRALSDPCVGAALQAIHAEPARRWTVAALVGVAGVSRSTLALRFKQKAGTAPLDYLLRWRMRLAARALRQSDATITLIAQRLGYDSDSAFSNAFKRIMGCAPRDYRRAARRV